MCVVPSHCVVCLLLCKEEGSSLVSLQLLRGGIWACMRCPSLRGPMCFRCLMFSLSGPCELLF